MYLKKVKIAITTVNVLKFQTCLLLSVLKQNVGFQDACQNSKLERSLSDCFFNSSQGADPGFLDKRFIGGHFANFISLFLNIP